MKHLVTPLALCLSLFLGSMSAPSPPIPTAADRPANLINHAEAPQLLVRRVMPALPQA